MLVLSCPELYSLRCAKAWADRVGKIVGLSYPELMYSHRCARSAVPEKLIDFILSMIRLLESGDRSNSLNLLFWNLCILVGVRKAWGRVEKLVVL